jgi:hypothetical protein
MNAEEGLEQIRQSIAPVRTALLDHPVYRQITDLRALRTFMQYHVFAVWDFMSLLKSLQLKLTSVCVPWLPPADPVACRLVNEIVLGEECDSDGHGGFASHFELYLRAMRQCEAPSVWIDGFIARLSAGNDVDSSLRSSEAPPAVEAFVRHTFATIHRNDLPVLAAVFTFGREDLLPDVFARIVRELNEIAGGDLQEFIYYLERHIELDGGEHGPLAHRLVAKLCGNDAAKWRAAADAARATLEARLALWDGISKAITK